MANWWSIVLDHLSAKINVIFRATHAPRNNPINYGVVNRQLNVLLNKIRHSPIRFEWN